MWQRLEEVREDAMDWIAQVKEMNADDFAKKVTKFSTYIQS